jgi:hypothetical protein
MSLAMASTIGVPSVAPRVPPRARRGARTSHVLRASERRAQTGDDSAESGADRGDKLMGRRGTFREAKEDDEATAQVKKSVKLDGAFGKPSASKETWEPFQRTARAGLIEACLGGADGAAKPACEADLVMTSLYVAMEDDAFKSRTAVCLPVDAYVKRVDKLVNEFMQRDFPKLPVKEGSDGPSADDVVAALEEYLYSQNDYRVPGGWREAYSPYRTYFHNVVAQKVGIPATLAALYIGCVERLKTKGALREEVDVMIVQKAKGASGAFGVTAPKAPWGSVRSSARDRPRGAVVCTPKMAITLQLQALKRAFWPWEWDDARDSGVLLAVEAAAYGGSDRMNTAAGVVGIIQPTGRPFGDLPMAILATERLLELDGGKGYEQRDLGILKFHDGKKKEALEHLEKYEAWKESGEADAAPQFVGDVVNLGGSDAVLAAELQVREDEALARVLLQLRKDALEETVGDGVKSGEV